MTAEVIQHYSAEREAQKIKASIAAAERSASDADKHWHEAGERLKRLKKNKPQNCIWRIYVRDMVGISREKADRLIRVYEHRATVKELRAKGREAKQRHDEGQRVLRNTRQDEADEEAGRNVVSKLLTPKEKRTAFLMRASAAKELATNYDHIKPTPITQELAEAARATAEAWLSLAQTLEAAL